MISAAALYVAHAGSSHRCEETILGHGGGVVSGRAPCVPEPEWENRHTLDGLAVPNRQFCRAFWGQVGSHVSLLWRSQQSFSNRAALVTACRVHESSQGEKYMGDGRPPVPGTGASAVKPPVRSGWDALSGWQQAR